jgi:hypothetical protein
MLLDTAGRPGQEDRSSRLVSQQAVRTPSFGVWCRPPESG